MKRSVKLISVALTVAVAAAVFTGCSSKKIDRMIIGKWICTAATYEGDEVNLDLTFSKLPTLELDEEGEAELSIDNTDCDFKWSAKNGKVTLKLGSEEFVGEYTSDKITFEKLTGLGMTFVRYSEGIQQAFDIVKKGEESEYYSERNDDWDEWGLWEYFNEWWNWDDEDWDKAYGPPENNSGSDDSTTQDKSDNSAVAEKSDSDIVGSWVSCGVMFNNKLVSSIFGYNLQGTVKLTLNDDYTSVTDAFGYTYTGTWKLTGENSGSASSEGETLNFWMDGEYLVFEYSGMNVYMQRS